MDRLSKYAFCKKCDYFMWEPITCECGRTVCLSCAKKSLCRCKSESQVNTVNEGPFIVNKKIQNIAQQFLDMVISQQAGFKATQPLEKLKLNRAVKQTHRPVKKYSERKISFTIEGNILIEPGQLPPWLQPSDIECTICMETFMEPITTPCGHMFCRLCIERHLYYSTSCPLCVSPLNLFDPSQAKETFYMSMVLFNVHKYKAPKKDEMFVPILSIECCIFPDVPNYLILEDTLFLFNLLSSPKKLLGIVPIIDGEEQLDFGTLVEIRNVIYLESGLRLITVVGSHRFEILHRYKATSCLLGHIQKYYDTCIPYTNSTDSENDPPDIQIANIKFRRVLKMFKLVILRAKHWYDTLESTMQDNVSSVLDIPNIQTHNLKQSLECVKSYTQQGPDWLWHLITVLPVNDVHKTMLLKSKDLEVRLQTIYSILIFCSQSQ